MTTLQILLSILSSSVLSAGLTSVVNYFLTKKNYKNDYYKKILDKRIHAYEEIEALLTKTKLLIFDNEKSLLYSSILESKKTLDDHIYAVAFLSKNSLWLSSEMAEELTNMNMLLMNIQQKAYLSETEDDMVNNLGHKYMEDIRASRKKLSDILKIDLKNLHQIEAFLNDLNMNEDKPRKRYQVH